MLLTAVGVDGLGDKHPLAVIEGPTENDAVMQALLDNLTERGWDPTVCRRRASKPPPIRGAG